MDLGERVQQYYINRSGSGHELASGLFKYLEGIEDVEKLVDENEKLGFDIVKEVKMHGGPKPLQQIPWEKLREDYKWDELDVKEARFYVNNIQAIWDKLKGKV